MLAQILPRYIIPSRTLRSSSTTISPPLRKTSIATSRSFSSTASDVWDKLPLHVSSASALPVFGKASTIYSFMPTMDSLHRPSKSEFLRVSCRPPNASNCLAGRAPEYLIELCHSVNDIPARRNLRSSSQVQLLIPRYRKERSGPRGFSVSSPQLWNLLPADVQLLHNEQQLFRKILKTHYMQQSMLRHWGSMSPVWSLLLLLLTCSSPVPTISWFLHSRLGLAR